MALAESVLCHRQYLCYIRTYVCVSVIVKGTESVKDTHKSCANADGKCRTGREEELEKRKEKLYKLELADNLK